jgi:hypothetical protein
MISTSSPVIAERGEILARQNDRRPSGRFQIGETPRDRLELVMLQQAGEFSVTPGDFRGGPLARVIDAAPDQRRAIVRQVILQVGAARFVRADMQDETGHRMSCDCRSDEDRGRP